jgi:nucleoside-diphosphate-sugar epimerase
MTNIVLTGATGFVGSAVLKKLVELNHSTTVVRRSPSTKNDKKSNEIIINSIDSKTDWKDSLSGADVIIHCAARVHVMNEKSEDPLFEFREVNLKGTLNLAEQAIKSDVKRFVFISTIKVGGESSETGHPLTEKMAHIPEDPYGLSKYEAEQALSKLAMNSGMEVVIIRPTLIYGPGVKANFETMIKWLSKGVPLPLGATTNKRSLVALDNLVDFIALCVEHPKAANETFYISDDNDLSTTQLLKKLSDALNKRCYLLPIPSKLLSLALTICGLKSFSTRLLGSLQVSPNKAKALLDWKPAVTVEEAFKKTTDFYKEKHNIK